jgi:hypothetical protein
MLTTAGTASAHPHTVNGHPIADSQLHAPFNAAGDSCGGDPAAYGLEVAHHGPDLGTPGFGDGCYRTTVTFNGVRWVPTIDRNPAID